MSEVGVLQPAPEMLQQPERPAPYITRVGAESDALVTKVKQSVAPKQVGCVRNLWTYLGAGVNLSEDPKALTLRCGTERRALEFGPLQARLERM